MSLEAININGGLIADGNSDVVDGVPAAADDDVLIVLMYDTSPSGDSTDGTDAGTGDIDDTTSYSSFHCKKK